MGNTYNDIQHQISKKYFNPASLHEPPLIDDIEFMINELVSDGELSSGEYNKLNSELDRLRKYINS